MNEWDEDDDHEEIEEHERHRTSDDEQAYMSTLETFGYEIEKKKQQIEEWRALAAESRDRAIECDKLIKDAEERIAQLERRWIEVEQQEHHSPD